MTQPKITLKTPWQFLASGFGAGLSPIAPGTIGTLMAIPLWLLLTQLSLSYYLGALLFLTIAGIIICHKASHELGVHDHGGIVWDEFVGYWITMIGAPLSWPAIVLGFIYFRVFDILKPWPIKIADEKITGGLGIMIDDMIAGLFALILLQITLLIIPF